METCQHQLADLLDQCTDKDVPHPFGRTLFHLSSPRLTALVANLVSGPLPASSTDSSPSISDSNSSSDVASDMVLNSFSEPGLLQLEPRCSPYELAWLINAVNAGLTRQQQYKQQRT